MMTLALAATLLSAVPAPAQDGGVGLRYREWFPSLDGDVHVQDDDFAIDSGDIDLDSTLGMDDAKFAREIEAYVEIPFLGRLGAGGWFARFQGDKTLSETITFGDSVFTVGTAVETELDLDVYNLYYEFVLPLPEPEGPLDLDLGAQVGLQAIHAEGSVAALGQDEDGAFNIGHPFLGARGALTVAEHLRGEVGVRGLAFSYSGNRIGYFDVTAELVLTVQGFYAGGGWKHVILDAAYDGSSTDADLDIRIDGPYLTAGIRF